MNEISGDKTDTRIVIGWREWISLPSLGIQWIKAKVDTGAKTSSVHAFAIEPFVERGQRRVRFCVHPLQNRRDVVVECIANVKDYRLVSDSGGHREKRYVIEVPVIVGGIQFPIEITLANRDTMSFRMLFGRSAMNHVLIEPSKSFLLGHPKTSVHSNAQRPQVRKAQRQKTQGKRTS